VTPAANRHELVIRCSYERTPKQEAAAVSADVDSFAALPPEAANAMLIMALGVIYQALMGVHAGEGSVVMQSNAPIQFARPPSRRSHD
jgi:hypothetical protein